MTFRGLGPTAFGIPVGIHPAADGGEYVRSQNFRQPDPKVLDRLLKWATDAERLAEFLPTEDERSLNDPVNSGDPVVSDFAMASIASGGNEFVLDHGFLADEGEDATNRPVSLPAVP